MKEKFCHIYYRKKKENQSMEELRKEVLQEAFRRSFGISYQEDLVEKGEKGKPYYKKDGIFFNLSHTREMVAVACANLPVGVDIEQPRKISEAAIKRSCTAMERKILQNVDNPQTEFLKYWTLKESYVKMTGEGMQFSFDKIEFILEEKESERSIRSNCEGIFRLFDTKEGFLAVCLHNEEETAKMEIKILSI